MHAKAIVRGIADTDRSVTSVCDRSSRRKTMECAHCIPAMCRHHLQRALPVGVIPCNRRQKSPIFFWATTHIYTTKKCGVT